MSTLANRLSAKTRRAKNGCLIFTGATNAAGYGNIFTHSVGRKTFVTGAHRAAYEIAYGPIPDGLHVLHHCDNPSCVEPSHLFLGTPADNMQDKAAKGRAKPGPASRSEWWTASKRSERAKWSHDRQRSARQKSAKKAGVPIDWKRCPTCATWKPLSMFNRNAARLDGYASHCKPCKHSSELARLRRSTGRKQRSVTRSDKIFF